MNIQKMELLAQVASLYFVDNQTQDQIAQKFGYSRSMVSRLLAEARQSGVVEFRINHQVVRNYSLEQELVQAFSLREARVLSRGTMNADTMLRYLGMLSSAYLQSVVRSSMRIGVSWGSALWETINAMQPMNYVDVDVIGIIGAVGSLSGEMDGPEIARRLARLLGGRFYNLPAPLIVENEATQKAIMQDASLSTILDMAGTSDMVLVGIGSTDPDYSSIVRAGYLAREEMQELYNQGIIGDVCAIHFDANGRIADIPINRRVIGIQADDLRKIPLRVAVAGGSAKSQPIYGACKIGLVNVLITDEIAAQGALSRKGL
jgi:deoxyribonucleoside regulator